MSEAAHTKILSLVTPLYKTKRHFLEELVESVATAPSEDIELVLVNDSPGDQMLRINVRRVKERFGFISYYENPGNLGLFRAYRNGFLQAKGRFCCILDHDDVMEPGSLAAFLKENQDADMVFTNEYKFADAAHKKRDIFEKPDFDILSTVFYFFTHHVTCWKTDILQKALLDQGDNGEYNYGFDINALFEYMKQFPGEMKTLHFGEAPYGWRIHAESTASSLGQKPLGYLERLRLADSLMARYGEYGRISIHPQVGYVMEGEFSSLHDASNCPLTTEGFAEWIRAGGGYGRSHEMRPLNGADKTEEKELAYLFDLTRHIPFAYLRAKGIENLFLPLLKLQKQIDSYACSHQMIEVPFLAAADGTRLASSGVPGLLVRGNDGPVRTVMMCSSKY